jgi:HK97 gp10 family phage protein
MQLKIEIPNIKGLTQAFANAPREMEVGINNAIRKIGIFLEGKTKEHITSGTSMWKPPIDTGLMRSGIQASFSPGKSVIRPSSSTPYAEYVHEGTKHMEARPFFEITANAEERNLEKFVEDEITKVINKLK